MMKKCIGFFALLILTNFAIQGTPSQEEARSGEVFSSRFPVEVSFLIADLKMDKERGVQVCEIQNGSLSSFKGERFSCGDKSYIADNLLNALNSFAAKSWVKPNDICDLYIKERFEESPSWQVFSSFGALSKNKSFTDQAAKQVFDPNDIFSYSGLIYCRAGQIRDLDAFLQQFPSMIVIDRATIPYWVDKYKMSLLFKGDPLLEGRKPRWNLYQSKYTKQLANSIIEEIQSDIFVIKPREQFLGRGVIIVSKEELDATLKYILNGGEPDGFTPDGSHQFWRQKKPDTFLVEEFIHSDPISVPHLGGLQYCPTMRLAFLLIYHQQQMRVEFLGGYYSLPGKALDETGTLNERYKSICKLPYYTEIPLSEMKLAEDQLREALLVLYQKMLQ